MSPLSMYFVPFIAVSFFVWRVHCTFFFRVVFKEKSEYILPCEHELDVRHQLIIM